jgi:predicted lipid-binding transport protein (Tim44 family)
MRRKASILAAFAVVALALAPALAEARRGGGFSSGSRGARTYQAPPSTTTAPSAAQPMQRTQQAPATAAAGATAATGAAAATRGGMRGGLMGGLLGAGLFGMLLGAGLFGGLGGFASILGLLLQVALIGGVIWLVMRLIRSRRPATAGAPDAYARDMQGQAPRPVTGGMAAPRAAGAMAATAPAVETKPLQIGESDYQAFEQNLHAVNEAWSRQDLEALRRLSTPEMTNYFAQDLKDLRARGWTNVTSGTKLEAGDLSEAWQENGQHYATVAMRYSIVDVTTDATGKVVEGHPTDRQTVTELLTYTRFLGEAWRLSAIQQTG